MSQPFTRHVWTGRVLEVGQGTAGNTITFTDDGPIPNCTLLRTLMWVHFSAYSLYSIGSGAIPNQPVGFAFGDINSQNYNGNEPSDDPTNQYVELIANASTVLDYTALSFPPDSTAHLTGSVNSIVSDAQLDTTYNLNTFMYGNKTLFVDSNAQRIFPSAPEYKFTITTFGGIELVYPVFVMAHIRQLYRQAA